MFIADTHSHQYGYNNKFENKSSSSNDEGFRDFIRNILPPPPDSRQVILRELPAMQIPEWAMVDVPEPVQEFSVSCVSGESKTVPKAVTRPQISCVNTTLIGTYISATFPIHNRHWLVQAVGNNTFDLITQGVKNGTIAVNRRYIFIEAGANQLRSVSKELVEKWLVELLVAIRNKNPESKIFITGVLPRPIENEVARPLIIRMNRWLSAAVVSLRKYIHRMEFVPVQLRFLTTGGPRLELFNEDGLTLNQKGAALFRASLFQAAGFVKNE